MLTPNPLNAIPPSSRGATLAVCGLLVLAVGLVFGQTACFSFVDFDNDQYVYANPTVCHGLTLAGARWAFTTSHMSTWHPLTWLSLLLECRLFRLNAGAYHVSNAVLHAAAAGLLFLALRRMTLRLWPSALAAAVFAIHPLRAESVAWITERKDVLAGLFFALTLLAYERYARRRSSWGRYAAVMLFFALGLLSKSIVVTVPFVLLLLDYWPLGRLSAPTSPLDSRGRVRSAVISEKLPLLALAGLAIALTLWAQGVALSPNEHFGFLWRLRYVPVVYVTYLARLFWPAGLAVLYPRPGLDLPLWQTCDSLALLLAVTALALMLRRRCPYLLVGWLWYLGMSVPIIGFLQFGVAAVADRFTYLPEIGLAIALAFGAADAFGRLRPAWDPRIDRVQEGTVPIFVSAKMGLSPSTAKFSPQAQTSVPAVHERPVPRVFRRGGAIRPPRMLRAGRAAGGPARVRMAADRVLARQRNALEAGAGLHVGKLHRAQQPGLAPRRSRADHRGHATISRGHRVGSRLSGCPFESRLRADPTGSVRGGRG